MKILFICKERIDSYGISFGLLNSARFVSNYLKKNKIESKVVTVIDNNHIDKEVHDFKPSHVIIEAYWVVPSKLDVLCKRYPNIQWIIRGHSKIPFFANEGIAMDWTNQYIQKTEEYKNLYIAFNEIETVYSIYCAFGYEPLYLPNIYSPEEYSDKIQKKENNQNQINIGCFGAIRPMKNQLQQAFAAIQFAERNDLILNFHVNSGRIEQKADNILKNMRALFSESYHNLVEHSWLNHREFIKLVKTMDIGLQVSFSESFNIVAADFVHNGIPIIGSKDIKWLFFPYKAEPNSIEDIVRKMEFAMHFKKFKLHNINKIFLEKHNKESLFFWIPK